MPNLSLTFGGVCAFVAKSPVVALKTPHMRVVLVDARKEQDPGDGSSTMLHPHTPRLVVYSKDLDNAHNKRSPDRLVLDPQGEEVAIFELDTDELEVLPDGLPFSEGLTIGANFQYVPEMGKVDPDANAMSDRSVSGLDTAVVARLKLHAGTIDAVNFFDGPWTFDPNHTGSQYPYQLTKGADRVRYVTSFINFMAISSRLGPISLRPANGGNSVNISVFNLPEYLDLKMDQSRIDHFKWFYKLCQNKPGLVPFPIPTRPPLSIGTAGLHPIYCALAQFAASDLA